MEFKKYLPAVRDSLIDATYGFTGLEERNDSTKTRLSYCAGMLAKAVAAYEMWGSGPILTPLAIGGALDLGLQLRKMFKRDGENLRGLPGTIIHKGVGQFSRDARDAVRTLMD